MILSVVSLPNKLIVLMGLVLVVFPVGCGPNLSSPENTIDSFYDAVQTGRCPVMMRCTTGSFKSMLKSTKCSKYVRIFIVQKVKIESVEKVIIRGNEAEITLMVSNLDKKRYNEIWTLINKNGSWFILELVSSPNLGFLK